MTISPNFQSITAVIFDWDFTLAYSLDQDVSPATRTTTLFQTYGVDCTEADVIAANAALADDIASGAASGSLKPQKKREIVRLYQQLLHRLDHSDSSYAFAYQIYTGYGRLPHTLFDDALPTLHALQERNYLLGILSNHSTSVRNTITQLLGDTLPAEHITISEEVGVHKPNKTIFQQAAAKLGQNPENCLYVGDNLEIDATAAVQKGGFAAGIWLDRSGRAFTETMPASVYRLTALTQLISLL